MEQHQRKTEVFATAFTAAKPLFEKGMNYDSIAKELNKKGYRSLIGKPWSGSLVSKLFLDNGIRKKKGGKRASRKTAAEPARTATTSKWALLECIESCTDLRPESKKALLELAFKEMVR